MEREDETDGFSGEWSDFATAIYKRQQASLRNRTVSNLQFIAICRELLWQYYRQQTVTAQQQAKQLPQFVESVDRLEK